MKKFIKYTIGIALALLVMMAALDFIYTYVYENSRPRNKFQYIMKLAPQQIDYVFLGSSRTANHIIATDVAKMTGKTAINLGIEGAVFEDNLLQLKLLIDRKVKMQKVLLQVDYLYETRGHSNIANSAALPYLHHPVVKQHLKDGLPEFNALYYVPFYRYMVTEFAIGFREFFFTAAQKQPRDDLKDGFIPKVGTNELTPFSLPKKIANGNATLDSFAALCDKNNVELVLFVAPMCSTVAHKEYITKLKTRLPKLRDYSQKMPDSLFYNCGHLNDKGAVVFTKLLTYDCLMP